jgi:hypothetical protein
MTVREQLKPTSTAQLLLKQPRQVIPLQAQPFLASGPSKAQESPRPRKATATEQLLQSPASNPRIPLSSCSCKAGHSPQPRLQDWVHVRDSSKYLLPR